MSLNAIDHQKLKNLAKIMEMNNEVMSLLSAYLTKCPNFITQELVDSFCHECGMSEEEAFCHLLIAACGLKLENDEHDRQLATAYLMPGIRKLDYRQYQSNSYYQHIHIPEVHFGNWELKYEKYQPYELFVRDDIISDENFKEIPQIGFFNTEFTFPVVMENENEWMAIKPNEIETMREAIECVSGHVVTFGLGLGYYAYMVSEKNIVKSITIIEKDVEVINLFETYILPQFPNKKKVSVVQADAFDYATCQMVDQKFDFAFVDLWHDVSDGFPLYLKMKKLELLNSKTTFLYWIENSLLSHMRWDLFQSMNDLLLGESEFCDVALPYAGSYDQFVQTLKNSFLKKLARGELEK